MAVSQKVAYRALAARPSSYVLAAEVQQWEGHSVRGSHFQDEVVAATSLIPAHPRYMASPEGNMQAKAQH